MARCRYGLFLVALLASANSATGASPPLPASFPQAVLAKARPLVSGAIGNGFFVHVWTAPSRFGGRCYFDTVDHRLAARQPSSWPPNGGGSCSGRLGTPADNGASHAFPHLVVSWRPLTRDSTLRNWVPPYVRGEVTTAAKPARVVVQWRGGALDLRLQGRYFAGGSSRMYEHLCPLTAVAYDGAGRVLARIQR